MAEIAILAHNIQATDESLAASARRGDRDAFAILIDRNRHMAIALAGSILRNRDDVEDAVQEAFVRAYQSLDRFRPGEAWTPWQMRIVQNVCRDQLRRGAVRRSENLDPRIPDSSPTPEELLLDADGWSELRKQVWKLPEKFRVPILMRYAHGQSNRAIACAIGIPESTVVGRLAGGLRILRRRMKGTN